MVPLLHALKELGGSATIEELNERIYSVAKLPESVLQIPHSENDTRTEIEYRLAWTRTYLKKVGLLENSERGVWALSEPNLNPNKVSPEEIVKVVREADRVERVSKKEARISKKSLNLLRKRWSTTGNPNYSPFFLMSALTHLNV